MAGHSKWANIQHRKGAQDAKRGKLFTRFIREITIAARSGLPDPAANPRLRLAVDKALGANMSKDTIERAIKRGSGELEGVNYEEVRYEGYGIGGAAVMVDCMTDNRNRTVAELRKIFEKNNGVLGGAGAAAWAFDRKGVITLEKGAATEDKLMEVAVGAGADDYSDEGEEWHLTMATDVLHVVGEALEAGGIKAKSSSMAYLPKAKKPLAGRDAEVALNLVDALDDHDDVQNVFADFDVSEEELQKLS